VRVQPRRSGVAVAKGPGRDQTPGMERLVRLITVLNGSESGVPAARLLDALQADGQGADARRKMLDRDLGHLNRLGYDIRNTSDAGADGVYRMFARDNRLRVLLTPAQRGELLRAVVATGRADLAPHLASDTADPGGPGTPAAPSESAPRGERRAGTVSSQLDRAMRAAARHCRIHFTYKGRPRVVHPHGVHSGPSGWYLAGREDGDHVVKEFVVSRMADVSLDQPGTALSVEQPLRHSLDPLSWEEDPPVDVVLEVSQEHLPIVVAVLGDPATTASTTDEALRATYRVTHRAVFRWRVYELGARVRVLSPDDVRAEMLRELAAMASEGR
jgi:predicted DNA-binding transcriptional regulator YafY